MILVFIFLGIIIFLLFINIVLILSTLKIRIENLQIGKLRKNKRKV